MFYFSHLINFATKKAGKHFHFDSIFYTTYPGLALFHGLLNVGEFGVVGGL